MNLATAPNVVFHYLLYFSSPFANFSKGLEIRLSLSPATLFPGAPLPNHTKMFEHVHLVTSMEDFACHTGNSNSCPPDKELGALTKWLACRMLVWVSAGFSTRFFKPRCYNNDYMYCTLSQGSLVLARNTLHTAVSTTIKKMNNFKNKMRSKI